MSAKGEGGGRGCWRCRKRTKMREVRGEDERA